MELGQGNDSLRMARHRNTGRVTWVHGIALCAVSAVIILLSVLQMERVAERTVFDVTVRNLRTSLQLRKVRLIANNQEQEIRGLVGSNPALLMDWQLPGYEGEANDLSEQAAGTWRFDRGNRELVYRFRTLSGLLFDDAERAEGRLSIQMRQRRDAGSEVRGNEGVELRIRNN